MSGETMIGRILNWLIVVPVAIVAIVLAVANRAPVSLSLDPIPGAAPLLTVPPVPLYAIIFGAMIIGVILGGVAVWMAQGEYRKRLRRAEASLARAETEAERLRADLAKAGGTSAGAAVPALYGRSAA